jgi:hypothetical protein
MKDRTSSTVRRAEGFVEIDVHDVETEVSGFGDAHQRIQVGPVAVHKRAGTVHGGGDLQEVLVEEMRRTRRLSGLIDRRRVRPIVEWRELKEERGFQLTDNLPERSIAIDIGRDLLRPLIFEI